MKAPPSLCETYSLLTFFREGLRKRVGNSCKQLERVGHSWKQLERVGNSCKQLETVVNSWKELETVVNSWKQLETVRNSWKQLEAIVVSTPFCQVPWNKDNDTLCLDRNVLSETFKTANFLI